MRKSFVETKYDALSIKHVYILKVFSFWYSPVNFYAKTICQKNKFRFFSLLIWVNISLIYGNVTHGGYTQGLTVVAVKKYGLKSFTLAWAEAIPLVHQLQLLFWPSVAGENVSNPKPGATQN